MKRAECTKENPMTPERVENEGKYWSHEGEEEVGEQRDGWPCGDLQDYQCIDCGQAWTSELPQ